MMNVTWSAVVLVLCVGTLLGAGVAFWKARTWHDVLHFILLGVFGCAAGQGVAAVVPGHLVRVGVVDIGYGVLSAAILLYGGSWITDRGRT